VSDGLCAPTFSAISAARVPRRDGAVIAQTLTLTPADKRRWLLRREGIGDDTRCAAIAPVSGARLPKNLKELVVQD